MSDQEEHDERIETVADFAVSRGLIARCVNGHTWQGGEYTSDEEEDLEEICDHADEDDVEAAGGKQLFIKALGEVFANAAEMKGCSCPEETNR